MRSLRLFVCLFVLIVCFFLTKMKKNKPVCRWATAVIELANRSFGSVKKLLDKEVRTIPFNSRSRSLPYTSHLLCQEPLLVMFYFTMLGSQIDLYFWNRLPNYFASAREAYKSLACRNLCTITLLLLWPDTGQHRSSAKILISRWKQRQKKTSCLVILRTE